MKIPLFSLRRKFQITEFNLFFKGKKKKERERKRPAKRLKIDIRTDNLVFANLAVPHCFGGEEGLI